MKWELSRQRNSAGPVRQAVFVSCLLAIGLAGCGPTTDYVHLEGDTMGTYYRVTARCPTVDRVPLETAIMQELDRVNAEASTYLPSSELSRFNASEPGDWMHVSAQLVEVLDAALAISHLTGGAFDVTVGPLIELWGFGPSGAITMLPSAEAVSEARAMVGYNGLTTRRSPPALRKERTLSVDLSAIAKGQGVDRLGSVLDRLGCTDFLVDIGGEVTGRGVNATGRVWRIGIEVPDPDRFGAIQRVIEVDGISVATSGDYRNFMNLEGERYSHTIDPRNGRPVTHLLASVSVVHESAMWADGFATALNVLGPEAGFELAEREGLAALFLIRQATDFEERYTAAMQTHLDMPQ